jgi:hypothetical protein
MNSQPEEDLQRRLDKIEAEINFSSGDNSQPQKIVRTSGSRLPNFYSHLRRFANWFNNLSGVKKLVVTGVSLLLGFAILQSVLKLVAAAISLALLSILVYLGYKFFVSNNSRA